jgi:ribose transport system substrate-binding protein
MRFGRMAVTLIGTLAVLGLAACGSESNESSGTASTPPATTAQASGEVAKAKAIADKYMAEATEWTGPTSGPKAVAEPKKIWWITCGLAAEGCVRGPNAAKNAAKVLGWDLRIVDGKFDPRVWNQTIQEAIDQKIDAVVLDSVPTDVVGEAVARARKAGVVVGSSGSGNDPGPTSVNFEISLKPDAEAEAMANYLIWKTDGKLDAHVIAVNEFRVARQIVEDVTSIVKACSGCKVHVSNVSSAETATRVPQIATSYQQQHPQTNTLLGAYDAVLLQTVPVMQDADINIASFNGIAPAIDFVRKGEEAATVGFSYEWAGWGVMDNLNRIFSGDEPVDQDIPIRLITEENIDSIPEGEPWDSGVDYPAEYTKLWKQG